MNLPGFAAETSLATARQHYWTSAHGKQVSDGVIAQLHCTCPAGLFAKACRLCPDPTRGGHWCDLCDHCFDCLGT
jgi:hypothetical protein